MAKELVETLYEDGEFVVVAKPAGVDVGGLADGSVPGLVELLAAARGLPRALQPVHRLSRYESGILVLGKNEAAAARLRADWKAQRVEQDYVAVLRGRMSKPTLALAAGRPSGEGTRRGTASRRPGKPAAPKKDTGGEGTFLRRLQQVEGRTLALCKTRAATTHALRAQLRAVGLRLLGDRLHDRSPRPGADRDTCLHLSGVRVALQAGRPSLRLRHDPPRAFAAAMEGQRDVDRPLTAALVRRIPCLVERGTNCFRLLNGFVEDLPGLVVERFGAVLIFQLFDPTPRLMNTVRPIAAWYLDRLEADSVYLKTFIKDRTKTAELDEAHRSPKPFLGKPAPPEVEVRERGARYLVRPYDGFSVGLFLDHRDNRSRVRELAAGKDVLNLFAYTCGFSVAAALGRANRTVSVDVSPRHLEWGKANFALNGLDLSDHLFFRSDAMEFLYRCGRQERFFDLIILDPPSFAHGRKSKADFSILTDLASLVAAASGVLRPDGVLMVSTNHRKLTHRDLRDRVTQGLASRPHEVIASPTLPPDFAMDPDTSKAIFVRVQGAGPPAACEAEGPDPLADSTHAPAIRIRVRKKT